MGYKGVQPTSTWGILRLQPPDPNLLPALPRGHHYANQLQGVQKVGAWPWQVDLGRLLCSEVKPPGKPSRVSWGNTCVFSKEGLSRSHLNYSHSWWMENFPMLNYHIEASMLSFDVWHVGLEGFLESNGFPQDDDPPQRSLVVLGCAPPKTKHNPMMALQWKKPRVASCCSFWSDRNCLLRRCLFFAKKMWSFVGSYSWRGTPHFLR